MELQLLGLTDWLMPGWMDGCCVSDDCYYFISCYGFFALLCIYIHIFLLLLTEMSGKRTGLIYLNWQLMRFYICCYFICAHITCDLGLCGPPSPQLKEQPLFLLLVATQPNRLALSVSCRAASSSSNNKSCVSVTFTHRLFLSEPHGWFQSSSWKVVIACGHQQLAVSVLNGVHFGAPDRVL